MKKKLISMTAIILALLMAFASLSVFANDGITLITGWKQQDGAYYHFSDSGKKDTGWIWLEDGWHYLDSNGKAVTGWTLYNGNWYLLDEKGGYRKGLQKVNSDLYYIDPTSGVMRTGWVFAEGNWYYFSSWGGAVYGWLQLGNVWYFLNHETGKMHTGWLFSGGAWYYQDPSGAMATGWRYVNGYWYYMNGSGAMVTGWVYDGGYWYYMNGSGAMMTGWVYDGGYWYYMSGSGAMVTEGGVVDGIPEVFTTSGVWIDTRRMDEKAKNYISRTNYLVLVSLDDKVTKVYTGSEGNWTLTKAFLCSVGDAANGSGTVTGDFNIGYSSWGNPTTRGYSFDDTEGHTLYYWTRFCDAYLFHSMLYDGGTMNLSGAGNGLGYAISHGCVRLRIENAKWIYDNVPDGSRVIVY